ncbi:MAG: methyltransferase [Oscillospiraceae bacterium]
MEHLEPLGGKYGVYVNENHRFGIDAILLADFCGGLKKASLACDLGTGCGIIPMLWIKNRTVEKAVGVEIQDEAARLAEKTVRKFSLSETFSVVRSDLKELRGKLPFGAFDLVSCNPPYKAGDAGIKSVNAAAAIARHETECTLSDVVFAAGKLLKFSGKLCLCHRPERLTDVLFEMRAAGIEPKKLQLVMQRENEEPWLILVEGRRGAKSGMRIMPPLLIEENGTLSEKMIKIYGDYQKEKM